MTAIKTGYGTNGQTITVTVASLADAAGRESTVISNTSDKFLDALVLGKVKVANSGSVSAPACLSVYAYGSVDGGTTYPDKVTGSDAAITLDSPTQLRLLGMIFAAAINTTYKGGPWSVASVFGGKLPEKWGIVVYNDIGTALSATGGDHAFLYQGIYADIV